MIDEIQKLLEAKNVIQKLASGTNPLDNMPIQEESFLNNPNIIRPLFYLSEYISKEIDKNSKRMKRPNDFLITDEQLAKVVLPPNKIGINEFARAVNEVINPFTSKKVSGVIINNKLKQLGVLDEEVSEEGKRRTITNEKSEGYGIESVTRFLTEDNINKWSLMI